jgi:hypothetical protein
MSKFSVAFIAVVGCTAGPVSKIDQSIVAGAGFTTFDVDQGGCKGSQNGINCNNYEDKGDVYASGGPNPDNKSPAALSDGDYYFAVITPGSQNGGFIDGANGNLSDTVAGGTTGDAGIGDEAINRTFTVADHKITAYAGTHVQGTSPNGQSIIQLAPYDDTDNPGGVYILAICTVGATSPSQCKFDAFRVVGNNDVPPEFPIVTGAKYYDANVNGQRDPGEVGIAGWPIDYHDHISETVFTSADGSFSLDLIADSYHFVEQQPTSSTTYLGSVRRARGSRPATRSIRRRPAAARPRRSTVTRATTSPCSTTAASMACTSATSASARVAVTRSASGRTRTARR